MFQFIIGIALGIALTISVRAIAKTIQLQLIRREVEREDEIQRRIHAHIQRLDEPWNDKGWTGPRPPQDASWRAGNGFQPIRHP